MTGFFEWVNEINTTAVRILVSVGLAAFGIIAVLIGILWRGWTPNPEQFKALEGIVFILLSMMGLDVLQFASKRFSDTDYVAAKAAGKPQVVSGGPTQVHVDGIDPKDAVKVMVPDTGPNAGLPLGTAPVADDNQLIMPLLHRDSEKGEGL